MKTTNNDVDKFHEDLSINNILFSIRELKVQVENLSKLKVQTMPRSNNI